MTAETQLEKLDRAADKRSDLAFLEAQLEHEQTRLLPFWRGHVFVRESGSELVLPTVGAARDLIDRAAELVWLGTIAGRSYFALDLSPIEAPQNHAALSGSELGELRPLLLRLPADQLELALYARALLLWHSRHPFCSVCGHATRPRQGGHIRVCPRESCGAEHFPRTDPCVLILVCDGDRCLLGRSKGWPPGMYSALAGFVEPGESLEQAAAREVFEETHIAIGATAYVASQPWPFPASLMIGFVAEALSHEVRIDEHELEAARWVTRDQLQHPEQNDFFAPPAAALAGQMIAAFAAGKLSAPSRSS